MPASSVVGHSATVEILNCYMGLFSYSTEYYVQPPIDQCLKFKNHCSLVPKRENFSLAFFALSEPIWVCDLETREKNRFFYQLTPDFDGFWFFAAY
jgi:hypothetical protein